ncbi:hypothetical protein GCM10009779_13430 [Polymorphospora rubra]
MKKTNSPFSIETDTSSSDGRDAFGYVFVTCSSRITGGESTPCNEIAKSPSTDRTPIVRKVPAIP